MAKSTFTTNEFIYSHQDATNHYLEVGESVALVSGGERWRNYWGGKVVGFTRRKVVVALGSYSGGCGNYKFHENARVKVNPRSLVATLAEVKNSYNR